MRINEGVKSIIVEIVLLPRNDFLGKVGQKDNNVQIIEDGSVVKICKT